MGAMDMAYTFQRTHINPQLRIDSRLTDINRWVERHNIYSTILELYPFLVKTWNEFCYPTSETNSRNWK